MNKTNMRNKSVFYTLVNFEMEQNNKSDGYEIRIHAHKFQRPGGFYCFNHSAKPSI